MGISLCVRFMVTLCLVQVPVLAAECCSKYFDDGSDHAAFWCPEYCCYKYWSSGRECCSDFYKRVSSYDRESSCNLPAWIPAVSSVVGIIILISIGVCIYKMCCQTRHPGHAIMPYGNQPNVTVVSSNTAAMAQIPGGYAYPPYNMPYQPQAPWPGSYQENSGAGPAFPPPYEGTSTKQ
ncbi:uncharacterized protein LOC127877937 isoform X2 [Dreissena polymorpha]|uniref:uncharacterized protein LOC127877937 isoform X2 n=1 Tax=Dreissena polymorpha TaxID=45954 RepID=UPI0022642A71|nr:uncharacterized protein LOC127877937 isoform X2 [Dreissena polymorpha]